MKYISTRGGIAPVSFCDAVMMGLARDGGLIVPESVPNVAARLGAWGKLSYEELAFEVMRLYADMPDGDLSDLIKRSYSSFRHREIAPVVRLNDVHVVELFHGPTLAFKDIALQFLGNVFEYIMKISNTELNILAATSGDTGSAAICGVRGRERMRIFVMYPHGRISETQERQMTSVPDGNVFTMAIRGTFDDCQRIMKKIFGDLAFRDRHSLGSVNSINWARVLAQIVYYFYAAFRVMETSGSRKVRFAVPTGNFGDILAGFLAARMGLPVGRLVLATNENDILSRFFNTGMYAVAAVSATISPSMDIQVASNFERYLYYRHDGDCDAVRRLMREFAGKGEISVKRLPDGSVDPLFVAGRAGTADTLKTIRNFHEAHGYLLDPHTAVGVNVGLCHLCDSEPMICLATAHPAKFSKAIKDATGRDLAHHPLLDALNDLPTRREVLSAEDTEVRAYIEARTGPRN